MSRLILLSYHRDEVEITDIPDSFEEFLKLVYKELGIDSKTKLCFEYFDKRGDKNIITKLNFSQDILEEKRQKILKLP